MLPGCRSGGSESMEHERSEELESSLGRRPPRRASTQRSQDWSPADLTDGGSSVSASDEQGFDSSSSFEPAHEASDPVLAPLLCQLCVNSGSSVCLHEQMAAVCRLTFLSTIPR